MILSLIFLFLMIATSAYFLKTLIVNHKEKSSRSSLGESKDFDISAYYERIERTALEILEEKNAKDQYVLTLWTGLKGLRMSKDGTFKWVQRGKNSVDSRCSNPISGGHILANTNFDNLTACCCLDMRSHYIESQITQSFMNTRQMIENTFIATQNAIHPEIFNTYVPGYWLPNNNCMQN